MYKNLRTIFLFTLPFTYLNFLEEYVTLANRIGVPLDFDPTFFLLFKFSYLSILTGIILLVKFNKFPLILLLPFGFYYLFQLEHIYNTILFGMYYPGLISGIILVAIGGFFWREVIIIGIKWLKRGYLFLSSSK